MNPRKQIGVALLCGVLLGGAAVWFAAPFMKQRRPHDPERMHQRLMNKFSHELSLSDAQARQVDQILRDGREKMRSLHDETFPRFEALRKETQTAIRALLTPEQQVRFDALHERWEKKKKRFRKHIALPPSETPAPRP